MDKPLSRRSFNTGEIAPTMWYREDYDKYPSACRELRNFLVHPHGAAVRRPGFKAWCDVSDKVVGSAEGDDTTDGGTTDSGTTDSGTTDSGTTEEGAADESTTTTSGEETTTSEGETETTTEEETEGS